MFWYQISFIGLDFYKRPNVVACIKVHVSGFLGEVRRAEGAVCERGWFIWMLLELETASWHLELP